MPNIKQIASKPAPQFWTLCVFLMVLFATGGASRADVQSLIILGPLSFTICAVACMTLRREHLVGRKWLTGLFAAAGLLALLHVMPLPSTIWQALPGRQEMIEVEKLAGLDNVWRTLTLTPMNGWHAFASLFAPLAVILLGIQLSRDDLFRLLPLLIALAALSGFVGLLQAIGNPQGPLYFYRITNNGAAVGFFANRNHAATLLACLFPMLATLASTATGTAAEIRFRQLTAAAIGIVLVPLILVTGSRLGLLLAVIGLATAGLLYRRPPELRLERRDTHSKIKLGPILGGLAVLCISFVTYFFSRAEAINRLFSESSGVDSRTDFWMVSVDLIWKHFPFGSGSGSYVEAFKIAEPGRMLDSSYLNRAHNDWVETAVTFGLPGLVALAIAVIAFSWQTYHLWFREGGSWPAVTFGRLASVTILPLAIASVSDYPLRTPIMMGIFGIFILWFTEAGRERPTNTPLNRIK